MFVVRSLPRTGTHMMRSGLSNHPDLFCFEEIFHQALYTDLLRKGAMAVLRNWIKKPQHGFVVHDLGSFLRPEFAGVYEELWELLQLWTPPVINLHRRDLLRVIVSNRLAAQTQTWNQDIGEKPRKNPTVKLAWPQYAPLIRDHRRFDQRTRELFSWGHNVWHEDLVRDWDGKMAEIQQYLRVPVRSLRPKTRKLDTRPLCEIIENYDEVCQVLQEHGHGSLIEISKEYDEQHTVAARGS